MTHSPTKEAHGLALILKPDTLDYFFTPSNHPSVARYCLDTRTKPLLTASGRLVYGPRAIPMVSVRTSLGDLAVYPLSDAIRNYSLRGPEAPKRLIWAFLGALRTGKPYSFCISKSSTTHTITLL